MEQESERNDQDALLAEARLAFEDRDWKRARRLADRLLGRRKRTGSRRRQRASRAAEATAPASQDAGEPATSNASAFRSFEQFLRDTGEEHGSPDAVDRLLGALRRIDSAAPWLDRTVTSHLARRGLSDEQIRSSIDRLLAHVQERNGEWLPTAREENGITIMFSDIAGSTTMAEQLGDEAWLGIIRDHNAIIREQVAKHRGREISNRGDGFMVTFLEPEPATDSAIAIQRAITAHRFAGLESPIEVHIGLHTGNPAKHDGNFYGTDVNIAARIADDVAGPGEIVVSELVWEALVDATDLSFDEPETVALDGLSGLHTVRRLLWRGAGN